MGDHLILTIAVLGGTGKQGHGLAYRWAKAGYHVIIGSRSLDKAENAANGINERLSIETVKGMLNEDAARACDMAVLTVPYEAHRATLEPLRDALAGKVLVDVTVPLLSGDPTAVLHPAAGSAAEEAQQILGGSVRVAAAFQNISHVHLDSDAPVPCDVLVCGGQEEARTQVLQLVAAAGLVGWDAGPLANAATVEGLTPLLLWINQRHKMKAAGIRISGK